MPDRDYLFHELTISLCATCHRRVEAKVIIRDNRVYLQKHCPVHKRQTVLISTDAEYYRRCRAFLKPSQMPLKFNTPIEYGCPYDCGLCPDHEQHSCLSVVEVTDGCNLTCPVCYAESSPQRMSHRSLEQIEFMLDAVVRNEGEPDIVQISGGEPTIHPRFFDILDAAKARPIRHLMLNTNGIRIATDANFAARLAEYKPAFEVYLQFDSLTPGPQIELRGKDLTDIRRRAIERLNEHNISTTLVVTLKKGLNDDQVGDIIRYALQQPAIRGVTFQPVQHAGRTEEFDPATDRLTLGEVRQTILDQWTDITPDDMIPVPCHPDCLAMAYALKTDNGSGVLPLTGLVDPEILLHGEGNTIIYEQNPKLRAAIFDLFSTAHSPDSAACSLQHLLCCLPGVNTPESISYDNVFRVMIVQFLDAHNFDVRSVKKSCIHIVHPDGRIIPFDTYNLFYRDGLEASRLTPLRVMHGESLGVTPR
ncbi:MAG: radical SAM protein [Phycisphaera sp.]|nr:radical SAM protein [Phycisphaera sp.]